MDGHSRHSPCLQAYCDRTTRLGPSKLLCRPKVFSRPLLVFRSENSTRGLHQVYPSGGKDDASSRVQKIDGIPGRVFLGRIPGSGVEDVVHVGRTVDGFGVLHPFRQDGATSESGKVFRIHPGCPANEAFGSPGQIERRQVSHQASLFSNMASRQKVGKDSRETQFHGESHLWRQDFPQACDRPGGGSQASGQKGFQNNKASGGRSSLVAPVHGVLEWRSTNFGQAANHSLQPVIGCIGQGSRSCVRKKCNFSSSHSCADKMAHQRERTVCLSRGYPGVGIQFPQETSQVRFSSGGKARQYVSQGVDQQGYLQKQGSDDHAEGDILVISNTRVQGHLCSHSGQTECNSGRRLKVGVLAHPRQLHHQEVAGAISSRERLHKEAQFYMNKSLSGSSKPGKVSQMRSYVRFAIVMNAQPIYPSEEFLVKYVCFLARTLPLASIWGYLHAVQVLHRWWSIDLDYSQATCPRLHLILDGIGSAGVQPTLRKKAAFGLQELLSLKDFCFMTPSGSVERTAWAAIIVCFWACLRSDNVVPKTARLFDPMRQICNANMRRIPEGVLVSLAKTKTRSPQKAKLKILLPRLDSLVKLCPVRAIDSLFASIPGLDKGPLFMFLSVDGVKPLLYRDLRGVIRNWAKSLGVDPRRYGSQSARSGSATTAYRAGVDEVGIRKLGDWLSSVFLSYVKKDVVDLVKIQMQMLNELTSNAVS